MDAPDHSGMSIASRNLAAGMLRLGCKPTVFALRDGENSADFRLSGCPVAVSPHCGRRFLGGTAAREAASLGVNIVHALSASMAKRAERMARRLGLPFAVTCNRLDEEELRSLSGFSGQGLVAVSRAIQERIANVAGIRQQLIKVIHNGLDLGRMPRPSLLESDQPAAWRTPVVGTLGHLSEKKGQRVFLQAVQLLLDRGLDAEFVILGDGPDRSALRGLADELNITRRVTFTPQTVSGQLNQLDILVEPSLQEGLGMSVMQAMATGVPVVATGVGGLYDLIEDGVTGVMVPAADPEALADAIRRLLTSPAERLELAKQARAIIEREFSADRAAEKHLEFYRDCMDRSAAR
jgi:glycosyltransferase involved in cell wall biosynthesis